MERVRWSIAACLLTASMAVAAPRAGAQVERAATYASRTIDADGTQLRYLDFGGEGLPILLTSGTEEVESWAEFAPRFTDRHRVVAIQDRAADRELLSDSTRAHDILKLLDGLDIERVVVMGNANVGRQLAYLGERYPHRLAGLVFLGNAPEGNATYRLVDPTGATRMAERAVLSIRGLDPELAGQVPDGFGTDLRYLRSGGATITVPSLTFVNPSGTRGLEGTSYPLLLAEQVRRGSFEIPDSVSRHFFERLNSDASLRDEVRLVWDTLYAPAILSMEETFYGAFSERLDVVPIDVAVLNGAPLVTGYEYRDRPDLIEPHVRRFLEGIR